MIRPILACIDPYAAAKKFASAGWNIDFSQPPESGDPLVGVSLCGNSVLLGITDGYVADNQLPHIGCGVEIYMTVPAEQIQQLYENHLTLKPTKLTLQPWGDMAFEVRIGGYRFMIAAVKGNRS
ncbi:MAG: hypothetical protein HDR30_03235 [Lachnospiraceae bacterium]|nr:hypothetical protein [Lachnospiraceae bacterium]